MSKSLDTQTDPPRLSQEGGAYAALADLRAHGLSPERLASGGESLARHIAGQAGAGTTTGASTGLAGKLGLGVLSLALLAGAWWLLNRDPERQPASAPVALVAKTTDAGIVVMDAGTPDPILDASIIRQDLQEPPPAEPPSKAIVPSSKADAAPPASQLPEQLRLLKEAKSLAQAGDHLLALERLAELSSRFPDSPLQAEVELRRAISLSGQGDLLKARAAVRKLLEDPRHGGRQAELHHMLVDIYVQQGACGSAQAALQAATSAGLDATSRVSAERGVLRCRPLTPSGKEN